MREREREEARGNEQESVPKARGGTRREEGGPEKEEGAWSKLKKSRAAGGWGGGDEEKVETRHEVNVAECSVRMSHACIRTQARDEHARHV